MEKKIFAYQFVVNDDDGAELFWNYAGGKFWTIAAQTALRILDLKPNFTDYVGSPDIFYLPAEIGIAFEELLELVYGFYGLDSNKFKAIHVFRCAEDYERKEYEDWKSRCAERYERADD